MDCHLSARDELRAAIAGDTRAHVVSVGDLGDKHVGMVYPDGTVGRAGSVACFSHARDYLEGFGAPFDLITGNHDLEDMDNFASDEENLRAWLDAFGKDAPQFSRVVADKTLLVGLSTTRFRDSPFSSHEVFVDDLQLDWFERTLEAHPASQGWRVLVFTHAPPMGSGVRALQGVHIRNGCAWLNHTADERRRRFFLRMVRKHACIKLWASGHFHLSHDYDDAIGWREAEDGTALDHCVFVQLGVIGDSSQRDGRRQTRLVRGFEDRLEIWSVNHHERGRERLDAVYRFDGGDGDGAARLEFHGTEDHIQPGGEKWFSARTPRPDDGCYVDVSAEDGGVGLAAEDRVCWWHMEDGAVLGVHDGMLIEYDSETLSPLGVVVEDLRDRQVVVAGKGEALLLVADDGSRPDVVHPNEDGSWWRKLQKNKLFREKCKQREKLADAWHERQGRLAGA